VQGRHLQDVVDVTYCGCVRVFEFHGCCLYFFIFVVEIHRHLLNTNNNIFTVSYIFYDESDNIFTLRRAIDILDLHRYVLSRFGIGVEY